MEPPATANYLQRHKWDTMLVCLLLVVWVGRSWLGLSWAGLGGCLLLGLPLAYLQLRRLYGQFVAAVMKQRCTNTLYVVWDASEPRIAAQAEAMAKQGRERGLRVFSYRMQDFNPFTMLYGAVSVAFLVNDTPASHEQATLPEAAGGQEPETQASPCRKSPGAARLLDWMASESHTRQVEGNDFGHFVNIVYTSEGHRRNAFMRVKYAVFSFQNEAESGKLIVDTTTTHPCLALNASAGFNMDEHMDAFQALRLCPITSVGEDDAAEAGSIFGEFWRALERTTFSKPCDAREPLPDLWIFYAWLWACPCCDQIEIEKMRQRPTNFAIGTLEYWMLMRHAAGRLAVWRHATEIWGKSNVYDPLVGRAMSLWYLAKGLFDKPPRSDPHFKSSQGSAGGKVLPPGTATTGDPNAGRCTAVFRCQLGDPTLLAKPEQLAEATDPLEMMMMSQQRGPLLEVHPSWTFGTQQVALPQCHWYTFEFVEAHFGRDGEAWASVQHPVTGLFSFFQVPAGLVPLLSRLQPGMRGPELTALLAECEEQALPDSLDAGQLRKWLRAADVLVPTGHVQAVQALWQQRVKELKANLDRQGWSLMPDDLLPEPFMQALRHYNADVFQWFGGMDNSKKFNTWNDEPVARYLQHKITPFMTRVIGEPLCHSSTSLSIFIRPGPGFLMHTDSSPPFDITLDICVEHKGPIHRSVYLASRNPDGSSFPLVNKIDLDPGQSILFNGGVMSHWGAPLPPDHYHNVVLLTWEFTRD